MQETLTKILIFIMPYVMSLLAAILIFVIGKWVAKMISGIIEKTLEKSKIEKTLASFAKNITYYAILIFVIIASLGQLGIQTNSFVAIIGAAGLAVGLALQGSLANFAAGVMVIILEPFKVGDVIEAGGASGTVQEIQIFSTIMSSEGKKIIVPNAKITGDKIIVHKK